MADNNYEELKQMARCVHLYFREQKQQREIASSLGVSASTVSRLVKRAYDQGWVQVEFRLPKLPSLAAGLIEQFGLRDAEVIPSGESPELKKDLGVAVARYFERTAGDGGRVGISCGLTLYNFVNQLRDGKLRNLSIYPLCNEVGLSSVDLFANTLVGMMAAKYRPHVQAFAFPTFIEAETKRGATWTELLDKNSEVRAIFQRAHEVQFALIGIGDVDASAPGFYALAERLGVSLEHLKKAGAVGEFNYQPIREDGMLLNVKELEKVRDRIISVPLEHLQTLAKSHGKQIVAVAGGLGKLRAIKAVLAGGLCNVLITDSDVARKLLGQ